MKEEGSIIEKKKLIHAVVKRKCRLLTMNIFRYFRLMQKFEVKTVKISAPNALNTYKIAMNSI